MVFLFQLPSSFSVAKFSREHKVKCYAYDLTVILVHASDHQKVLSPLLFLLAFNPFLVNIKLRVNYADDLTVISVNASDHQKVLSHLDSCCHDLGFTIRSDKCFSLLFDGQQAAKESSFIVGGGRTSNIHEHHTTFLGSIVAHSSRH